ncbi:60S ribosomal export protein NMD3 [Physcia stellaris]|nr:60S ribosomal export protein NMD3 [Physcia stellaris]
MTTRKRNEYLDISDSDDEAASGYDSEAAQESKGGRAAGPSARSSKRRRLDTGNGDSQSDDEATSAAAEPSRDLKLRQHTDPKQSPHSPKDPPTPAPEDAPSTKKTAKKTSKTETASKAHKRGVIYLSRIPPFMRPSTVRHHLSIHGTITRLFLTPEPPPPTPRAKNAKICVEAINGQIVGGKKGGWYRDDVWNAKYLKGFAWEDLMESVRREDREREEKIRVGIRREGRERKEFLRGVEIGKVEEGKKRKKEERARRREEKGEVEKAQDDDGEGKALSKAGFERRFKQNEISERKEKGAAQSDDVKRVLSKIF